MWHRLAPTTLRHMTIHTDTVHTDTVSTEPSRTFARSKSDSIVGGVCGGVARYFDWDANLVRAFTVVGALISFGTVALVYLAALMLLPQE